MFSDVGEWVPFVLIPAAAVLAGCVVARMSRGKGRPMKIISGNLEAVASQPELDLAQLQLEDAYGTLSEGWNRLIAEVGEARQELEAFRVQQEALETVARYDSNWVTQLLNKMSYGLLMVAEDLTIMFVNPAAERLLGQSREELLDRSVTDLFEASLESLRTKAGGSIDCVFDLESIGVTVRVKAVRTHEEEGHGLTALFLHDMSHQKEQERARDQFLYHITHELRTPLTNIRAYAETLSEGVLEDRDSLRECYNVIISETDRLSRLVEDILSVSQLEAGLARLEVDDVLTSRLIRQIVEDMQASADEKNVELTLSMPSKVPTIRGDKERLAIVFTNLIGNAVKYTPRGGQVEVSCVEDGARLQITVRDTGIGIAPEDQAKVFDKFYRASDEQVAQLPGTGLGLAIARETVRSHGGIIELESEPGKGSTFTVFLPVSRSPAMKSAESK